MSVSIMWFRTDLRLADHPALAAAVQDGADGVVPLVVIDDHFWGPGASVRQGYLAGLLKDFNQRIGGLHIRRGDPAGVVVEVAQQVGAKNVHISQDFTPYGRDRDTLVEKALADNDINLVRTGSAYAVSPGRITKDNGEPYRVFTPFYQAWLTHGWPGPAAEPPQINWMVPEGGDKVPNAQVPDGVTLPEPGEDAARARWDTFCDADIADYAQMRNLPGDDRTSHMSVYLKWGAVHPRTLLADLDDREGPRAYQRELAFRDFYADVLLHRPDTVTGYYDIRYAGMQYDEPGEDFEAWKAGQTGYPIVDAGMRQLLAEGWMHNRVRMIVASFLVKDLHIEWQHGARHFLDRLADGDLASNQHGWQWVAGCGTDAAPFFRIFNPTTQGKKFDPDGVYVRRWVPELSNVQSEHIHEPWKIDPPPGGYPAPLIDHAEERKEALRRYEAIKA